MVMHGINGVGADVMMYRPSSLKVSMRLFYLFIYLIGFGWHGMGLCRGETLI